MTVYYTLLEQHTNGAWWYHGQTFTTVKEAADYWDRWIWWDEKRPKMILSHTSPLPRETMVTFDLKTFFNPYNDTEIIAEL